VPGKSVADPVLSNVLDRSAHPRPGLTRVNRSIRAQTLPIWCSSIQVTLVVEPSDGLDRLVRWLNLYAGHSKYMKHVRIDPCVRHEWFKMLFTMYRLPGRKGVEYSVNPERECTIATYMAQKAWMKRLRGLLSRECKDGLTVAVCVEVLERVVRGLNMILICGR